MEKGYAAQIPFSPALAQEAGLLAENPNLSVYLDGRGAETLKTCLLAFRDEPGELWVFGGYRVFGGSRETIMATVKNLKRRKIVVVDKMNNERSDTHDSEMLDRALRQIMGSNKLKGSRKHARKIGAKGGKAKAIAAAAGRAERMPDRSVWKLVEKIGKTLTWRDVEEVTEIPTATLRRNYN